MPRLVFFDTETIDVPENTSGNIIIQLAGVIDDGNYFNDFANPGQPIAISAMEKHGITPEKIEGLPSIVNTNAFKTIEYLNTLDDVYFVCYNKTCDVEALKRVGLDISEKIIDLWRVIKVLNMKCNWDNTRLQWLVYQLGLYRERSEFQLTLNAHDALFDSYDLMNLYRWVERNAGMTIEMAVKITHEPIFYSTMPFGKHKGKAFASIPSSSLQWIYDNIDDPDILFTIDRLGLI